MGLLGTIFLVMTLTADPHIIQSSAGHCRVLARLAQDIAFDRARGVALAHAIDWQEGSFPRAVHSWGPQLARRVYGKQMGERQAYRWVMRECKALNGK